MSDEAHQQLADQFRTMLWLTWQTRRWQPVYRSAVAQVLRGLRHDIRELTAQRQVLAERGRTWMTTRLPDIDTLITNDMEVRDRLAACRRVLLTYRQCRRYLREFTKSVTPAERHALDRAEGDKYAELNHAVMDMVAPCLAQDVLDQVPALATFVTRCHMRFPLPPRLPWLIEEICRDLVPIRVVRFDDTRGEVVTATRIGTDFPLQAITDFFTMIYCAYDPQWRGHSEGPSARRMQSFDHYIDVFLVYELRQRRRPYRRRPYRRLSYTAIARQVWPEEFERYQDGPPHTNPIVHRVRNHLRLAAQLIHLSPGK